MMDYNCPVNASRLESCPVGSGMAGTMFVGLISTLLQSGNDLANEPKTYPKEPHQLQDSYDFLIIGAGSAGSVMANRLSEVEGWSVLVLEAGADPTVTVEVPPLQSYVERTPEDWQFKTVPQGDRACLGFKEPGVCLYPRGKGVGGSSNLYGMAYCRGNKYDFDGWAEDGNTGWSYQEVLPYFKKSEDLRSETIWATPTASTYHSKGGYLTVTELKPNLTVIDSVTRGVEQTGYPALQDPYADQILGFSNALANIRDGERCSNAKAFLTPAGNRKNLHLLRNAYVTKILIDAITKTAYGLEFKWKDKIRRVNATKEVILSAGAVQSPQVLMLSGVGPEDHLKEMGVEVIKNASVGYNLQDHIKYSALVYCINNATYRKDMEQLDQDYTVFQYMKYRTGNMAVLSCNTYLGFIKTNVSKSKYDDDPDIELQLYCLNRTDSTGRQGFMREAGFGKDAADGFNSVLDRCDMTIITLVTLIHPESRGRVYLNSADPFDKPLIDPQYFSEPHDAYAMMAGVDFAIKLGNTPAMKEAGTEVLDVPLEACNAYEKMTRDYQKCAMAQTGYTIYHPVATCKMGPPTDPDAVVDPKLKVYGINGLRVVDASVLPKSPSCNINAVVTMAAEKCADYIKADWANKKKRDAARSHPSAKCRCN